LLTELHGIRRKTRLLRRVVSLREVVSLLARGESTSQKHNACIRPAHGAQPRKELTVLQATWP
jgi:hypothetical protein